MIAAGLFLQKNGGGEEAQVVERHAIDQIHHRFAKGKAQTLLFVESTKFGSHWFGNFIAHHLEHGTNGVSGSQASRHEIDGVRQQGIEAAPPDLPQEIESDIRGRTHGHSNRDTDNRVGCQ